MGGTQRLLVGASLLLGLFHPLLWGLALPGAAMIALKGAGVGLLAAAALIAARTADGRLLALVLALGATGDVLIEVDLAAGASAFAAGHLVAVALYLRNQRGAAGPLDLGVAALLPAAAAVTPFLLLRGRPEALAFVIYGALVGAMAAAAWTSRFPRGLVALGALLFLASDMLIAARLAMAARPFELGLAIWLLYYGGQFLIFVGVSASLPSRERSSGGGGPAKRVEG
jgi:uncharacterized membrane protein YhhN